ncbi:hypothetical protein ABPG72_005868 [Tetrahymena utriculariae]
MLGPQINKEPNLTQESLDQKKNTQDAKELHSQKEQFNTNKETLLKINSSNRQELFNQCQKQSDEEIQKQQDCIIQQNQPKISYLDSQFCQNHFEKDLQEIKSSINLDLIQEYLQKGNETKIKVQNKDVSIIIGATGAGKTTTFLYLAGYQMQQEEFTFENSDEQGNKEIIKKTVIGSAEKLENAKIGNTKVSETQFLNVDCIEYENQKLFISDSPGFKDKRQLEIDLTNSLNTMKMLKACQSIRFIFLVNYFDLMAEKATPFIETALIFVKMLNGDKFETNLKSVSVFYTQAQGVMLEKIRNEIISVKEGIKQLNMINSSDQKLLTAFLNYLISQIDQKYSMILNPLDKDIKSDILEIISNKPKIKQPAQNLSKLSFSSESNSRVNLFCNLAQEKIEQYARMFKFFEVSELLTYILNIQYAIDNEQIENLKVSQQFKIENDFFQNLQKQISFIIENLKNGNRFSQISIDNFKLANTQLKEWQDHKQSHFADSQIDQNYLVQQVSQQFKQYILDGFQQKYEFENLYKITQPLDQLNEVLGSGFEEMKNLISEKIESLIQIQKDQAFSEISEKLQSEQLKNESEYSQLISNLLKNINDLYEKEEQAQKQGLAYTSAAKQQIKQYILNAFIQKQQDLLTYFSDIVKGIEDQHTDQLFGELSSKLNQIIPSFNLITSFAKSQNFCENYHEALQIVQSVKQKCKDTLIKCYGIYLNELKNKKLKSKYLKEYFMTFLKSFKISFDLNDYEIEESYKNYLALFEQIIKKKEEKIINLIKIITSQGKNNIFSKNDEDDHLCQSQFSIIQDNIIIQKDQFERIIQNIQVLESIKWMDSYLRNQFISDKIENFIKKLQKHFINLIEIIENIAEQIKQDSQINQKRKLFQTFHNQYLQLNSKKKYFGQIIPKAEERCHELIELLQKQFQDTSNRINNQIEQLESSDTQSKHFLLELETSLITLKYVPQDLLSQLIKSNVDLVDKFDDQLKRQINQIPLTAQWEILLAEKDTIFKKWVGLLDKIDMIKFNSQSLIILLEKSTYSYQILKNKKIKHRIKTLYNNLKNDMNEFLEQKEFYKAQQITDILNTMSNDLNEYLQLEFINNMNSAIRKEVSDFLKDMQNYNDLKCAQERLAHLKGILTNQKEQEIIKQSFQNQYEKQLKSLMKKVNAFKITDQEPQSKIEYIFEIKSILKEILEKEKLEKKFNEYFRNPFQNFSKNTIVNYFLQCNKNRQDQDLANLFYWYKKILDCLNQHDVNTEDMANLDQVLINSFDDQIQTIQKKFNSTMTNSVFSDIVSVIEQINSKKNVFSSNSNILKQLQNKHSLLKSYLDQELLNFQNRFNQYCSSNPININEVNKILSIIKQLQQIYQEQYNDNRVSELIKSLENKLEEKQQILIQPIQEYLETFNNNEQGQVKIQEILDQISKTDKIGFEKCQEFLDQKIQELCISFDNKLIQQKPKYNQILQILKQLLKLINLKPYFKQLNGFFNAEMQINKLKKQIQWFQINFEEILANNKNKQLSQNDFTDFLDMVICIQKLKEYYQQSSYQIQDIEKQASQINNIIYEMVRESINNYRQSYLNSNYIVLLKSLISLKKVDGIIQYVKQLQQSEDYIPEYCEKRLWEIIEGSNYLNYEEAQSQAQQLINNIVKDLQENWDNYKIKQFSKLIKSLKEVTEEYPQDQQMLKLYDQQKKKYETYMDEQSKKIHHLIENELWGKDLSNKVDVQQDQFKYLDGTDLFKQASLAKNNMQQILQNKLDKKFANFEQLSDPKDKCDQLIELRKICDFVPHFEDLVKKKINYCVKTLVWSADSQKQILILANQLSAQNDPYAELILQEEPNFKNIAIKNFMNKIKNQHTSQYVNKNIKNFNIENMELSQFSKEDQIYLESNYNTFIKDYEIIVTEYQKKINQIDQLAKEIIDFAQGKKKKFKVSNYDQESKIICLKLLPQICACWTLLNFKQDLDCDNPVYKELHASQIYSVMILLGFQNKNNKQIDNQLIQVSTGEGKSIILGILSTILALLGYNIKVVCYSYHLSDRDFKDFQNLFDLLKIQENIKYGTFADICEDQINEYGDIRQLSQELLNGNLQNVQSKKIKQQILLIDEVDVFFNNSFYGQTYNPCFSWKTKEIINIMNKIWINKGLKKQTLTEQIFKEQDFLKLKKQFPKMKKLINFHVESMIKAAQNLNDHIYHFENGRIGYQLHDYISFDTVKGYSTTFAYYQEMDKGNLTKQQVEVQCGINIQCGHFSYCMLTDNYQKILGVTGTLEILNQGQLEIIANNNVKKATIIPSIFGQTKLIYDLSNNIITFDQDEFFLAIIREAEKYIQTGQPVLIFFIDNSVLEKFKESSYVSEYKDKLQILNQQTRYIKNTVNKASRSGQLTLCERAFGRGTDFYCNNNKANDSGGTVVIQTFFSEDISEEYQIKGRTARQQNNGRYLMILQASDIQESLNIGADVIKQKQNCKDNLFKELDVNRKKLSTQRVRLLNSCAEQAKFLHDNSIKFRNYLNDKKTDHAIDMLIKINQGNLEQIHFLLLLDDSGSMKVQDGTNKSRWERLKEAIQTFIQERQSQSKSFIGDDIVSIIYHSNDSISVANYETLANLSSILQKNPPRFEGTKFYLAIEKAIHVLNNEPPQYKSTKKAIMFLSDGEDGDYQKQRAQSLLNLKQNYKEQIIGFWCIGFGPETQIGILNEMVNIMKDCGGQYKQAMNLVELQKNFKDLALIERIMTIK